MMNYVLKEDLQYIADYNLPYKKLKGKSVLVTGATGLIGTSLVRALLAIGDIKVIAFVRNEEKAKKIYKDFLEGSLFFHVADIVKEIEIDESVDYIFHCASVTTSKMMVEKPVETLMTSIEGTKNVLEFARKQKCKSVVYISSMEVYGAFEESKEVSEKELGYIDNLKIRSNYPESKRMCENMCVAYGTQYEVPVKIARLAQTFGAGVLPGENRVFAQFARSAMKGSDIVLHTEGKSEGNYCYTADAVRALLTILVKGENMQAYNVVNEKSHITIADMAKFVAEKIAEKPIEVVFDIPKENKFGYASDTKMHLAATRLMALGWQPETDLEESYRRLIASMKNRNV